MIEVKKQLILWHTLVQFRVSYFGISLTLLCSYILHTFPLKTMHSCVGGGGGGGGGGGVAGGVRDCDGKPQSYIKLSN